jgi:Do/DeqQ family serine protease
MLSLRPFVALAEKTMRKGHCAGACALAFLVVCGVSTTSLASEQPSLAPMLERVLPGIVSIAVQGQALDETDPLLSDPFFKKFFGVPDQQPPALRSFQAAGSGVIVDAGNGYILTNSHVIENAERISVTLGDGSNFQAKVVGTDPETDIAVVQIKAEKLTAVALGDSSKLRVGDYVAAIGNPYGLSQSATLGIVSALGRAGLGIEGYESFIQTDASINPGNSGGALVNLDGELIGINSAIMGPSGGNVGIGFAIPVNMAKSVMQQLIAYGKISRGQLGVIIQDLTPGLAKALKIGAASAAVVSDVIPGSPAAKAGIVAGDAIVSVNGQAVKDISTLRNAIGALAVDSVARLRVERSGKKLDIDVALSAAEKAPMEPTYRTARIQAGPLANVELQEMEPEQTETGKIEGVQVSVVVDTSPAAEAGLQSGDIIVAVNQKPVRKIRDVLAAIGQEETDTLLYIFRDGHKHYLTVGG